MAIIRLNVFSLRTSRSPFASESDKGPIGFDAFSTRSDLTSDAPLHAYPAFENDEIR
jgi:hypothetical protein